MKKWKSYSSESSDEKPKLDVDNGSEIESPEPNVYEELVESKPKPQKTADFGEKLHNPESDVEGMEVLERLSGTCEKIVESPKLDVYGGIESIKPDIDEEKVESPTKKAELPKPAAESPKLEEKVKSPRPDVDEKKGESPKPEEMEILLSSVSSDEKKELPTLDVHAKTTVESPNPNVDEKKLGSPVDKKNLESWTWTPKPIVEVETSKPLVDEENVESEVASSNLEKMEVPPSIEVKVPSPSHKRSEKIANSESSDTKTVPSDESEERLLSLKNVQSPNPQSGIETTVASDNKKVASEPAVDQNKFRSVYENDKTLKKLNELLEKYGVTLTDNDASPRPLLTVSNRKAVVKITPNEYELKNFDLSTTPSQGRINAVKKKVEKYKEKFRELCPNGDKLEIECKLGTVTVGLRLKNAKLNPKVWQLLDSEIEVQKQLRSEILK